MFTTQVLPKNIIFGKIHSTLEKILRTLTLILILSENMLINRFASESDTWRLQLLLKGFYPHKIYGVTQHFCLPLIKQERLWIYTWKP
jgi:hypothetical protein